MKEERNFVDNNTYLAYNTLMNLTEPFVKEICNYKDDDTILFGNVKASDLHQLARWWIYYKGIIGFER